MKRCLVLGGGGFIGGHLVRRLREQGMEVFVADLIYNKELPVENGHYFQCDLSSDSTCVGLFCFGPRYDAVFNLAADMGGAGYIFSGKHDAELMTNSAKINLNVAKFVQLYCPQAKVFYSSSACMYPAHIQEETNNPGLKESDAYPAMPDSEYGWEKLFSERLYLAYARNYGLNVRIARFHNVFGPCFDNQTEALTKDGWKKFVEIGDNDEIATLNESTGFMEYRKPLARQIHFYEGPMYRVDHRAADMLVTPDHSIYYSFPTCGSRGVRQKAEFRREKAEESKWDRERMCFTCNVVWEGIDKDTYTIPQVFMTDGRSMANKNGDEKVVDMDTWLSFVGWYLAEGCSFQTPSNYTVCITQTPGQKQKEIAAIVNDLGFNPSTPSNPGNQVIMSSKQLFEAVSEFGKGAGGKCLPRWYLELPPDRLRVLFDAMMAGDGDADGGRYSTTSPQLADAAMEIALKIGLRAWIGKEEPQNERCNAMYRVHISPQTRLDTRRHHRTIEHYSGMVYDVTVPNHILMVRRNGKPMWSGNCGTYDGGREKAPAAICRKVATAPDGGEIEIWGDGNQTRSFLYIDDCLDGIEALMRSECKEPVNIGSEEMVSINDLAKMTMAMAGKKLSLKHIDGPLGVRGRNSNNDFCRAMTGWEPKITLQDGIERTYKWIAQQVAK